MRCRAFRATELRIDDLFCTRRTGKSCRVPRASGLQSLHVLNGLLTYTNCQAHQASQLQELVEHLCKSKVLVWLSHAAPKRPANKHLRIFIYTYMRQNPGTAAPPMVSAAERPAAPPMVLYEQIY